MIFSFCKFFEENEKKFRTFHISYTPGSMMNTALNIYTTLIFGVNPEMNFTFCTLKIKLNPY